MSNKENFLKLVSYEKTPTVESVKERMRNRDMLHESKQIALKVLVKLEEVGWSQKDLANKMGVSPQQINKIVSGKENLTLETLVKLQNLLNIPLLATYNESDVNKSEEIVSSIEKKIERIAAVDSRR